MVCLLQLGVEGLGRRVKGLGVGSRGVLESHRTAPEMDLGFRFKVQGLGSRIQG